MKATNVLDAPLGYIPNLLSILLIQTFKTQVQRKIGPCLKLKLLNMFLDIKRHKYVLLHWDQQMKRGKNCPNCTRSHPDGRQSFFTLMTLDAEWLGTSQRYLPPAMLSAQLCLSFMDLRITATVINLQP